MLKQKAFTLIELLCVIAIIALLMAISLPSLSKARQVARSNSSRAVLRSIDAGCEIFYNDFGWYPPSAPTCDPIVWQNKPNGDLSGVHLIARAMLGHDTRGIDVKARGLLMAPDGICMSENDYVKLERKGAYMEISKNVARIDSEYTDTAEDDYSALEMPVLVDAFANPILYYRASSKSKCSFLYSGAVYNLNDNAAVTGRDEVGRPVRGWRFAKSAKQDDGPLHPMGYLGMTEKQGSFVNKLHVEKVAIGFETTIPKNPNRFILYSAGPDDTFGTEDDIGNW